MIGEGLANDWGREWFTLNAGLSSELFRKGQLPMIGDGSGSSWMRGSNEWLGSEQLGAGRAACKCVREDEPAVDQVLKGLFVNRREVLCSSSSTAFPEAWHRGCSAFNGKQNGLAASGVRLESCHQTQG